MRSGGHIPTGFCRGTGTSPSLRHCCSSQLTRTFRLPQWSGPNIGIAPGVSIHAIAVHLSYNVIPANHIIIPSCFFLFSVRVPGGHPGHPSLLVAVPALAVYNPHTPTPPLTSHWPKSRAQHTQRIMNNSGGTHEMRKIIARCRHKLRSPLVLHLAFISAVALICDLVSKLNANGIGP